MRLESAHLTEKTEELTYIYWDTIGFAITDGVPSHIILN